MDRIRGKFRNRHQMRNRSSEASVYGLKPLKCSWKMGWELEGVGEDATSGPYYCMVIDYIWSILLYGHRLQERTWMEGLQW